jgi:hypothetical protein
MQYDRRLCLGVKRKTKEGREEKDKVKEPEDPN